MYFFRPAFAGGQNFFAVDTDLAYIFNLKVKNIIFLVAVLIFSMHYFFR